MTHICSLTALEARVRDQGVGRAAWALSSGGGPSLTSLTSPSSWGLRAVLGLWLITLTPAWSPRAFLDVGVSSSVSCEGAAVGGRALRPPMTISPQRWSLHLQRPYFLRRSPPRLWDSTEAWTVLPTTPSLLRCVHRGPGWVQGSE